MKPNKAEAPKTPQVRMYVLDTNVLIHDPSSLFRFDEHDIYLARQVLRELDNKKKGNSEVARNSRTASRNLVAISESDSSDIAEGLSLSKASNGAATGRIFFQKDCSSKSKEPDEKILDAVVELKGTRAGDVILVSKDVNMLIIGRSMGIQVEDYSSDQVEVKDSELLYTGSLLLPSNFWETCGQKIEANANGSGTYYEMSSPLISGLSINEFACFSGAKEFCGRVVGKINNSIKFRVINDYCAEKNSIFGINARNNEQNYSLNLLLDPDVHIVTLLGEAGTGKTLLALAAGLEQVLEKNIYSEIIMTRVTVPMGEDIGFLPGTEEEKMLPWMGALDDNLDMLVGNKEGRSTFERGATRDLIRNRIKVKSLNFMRGRTFHKKFLIIDEAQNLTPKTMKALITRAGIGTKVVCLGNLGQIDTPYMGEGSSGLTYLVDRFRGFPQGGHITLLDGVRSPLANYANEVL